MAIKFLVCGYEASTKSTLTSKIKDVLVINFDKKEYNFLVPHINYTNYQGMADVINTINSAITAYKEAKKEFPKYVVLDTVTQMYSTMVNYNSKKYTGFNIHSQNNTDTLDFNDYLEKTLIANGVSVIIVAHTLADADTGRHIIPANGSFAKAGSFLSIVNDAIFIDKSGSNLTVYTQSFKYPARTTIDIDEKIPMDKYDINEHLAKLVASKNEAKKFELKI